MSSLQSRGDRGCPTQETQAAHAVKQLLAPVALAMLLGAVGCASAGVEFRPYLRTMPQKPLLTRAVSVDRRDVPALAQAGGVIIGHISAHATGFGAHDALEERAAREAARRGGTHLVAEVPHTAEQREMMQLDLDYLVVRLADLRSLAQLSAHLQPHRGVHYQSDLVPDAETLVEAPVPPLAEVEQRAAVRVVDGRHLKPLPSP
jgi:hypothetical protein